MSNPPEISAKGAEASPWWQQARVVIAGAVCSLGLSTAAMAAFTLRCPFRALTGWDCPLCGGTRAALSMLDGDWQTALRDNLAVTLTPLLLVLAGCTWWLARQLDQPLRRPAHPAVLVAVGLLLWTVLRNLPALDWLRPLEDA